MRIKIVINYNDGGGGNFLPDNPMPGGGGDDYALHATTTFLVSSDQAGIWTFATNTDDGSRLTIDGQVVINDDVLAPPHNAFGTFNLSAGVHTLDLVYFERGGGASVELFAAPGDKGNTFDSDFKLVGDDACHR